jgi:hypothetical protein
VFQALSSKHAKTLHIKGGKSQKNLDWMLENGFDSVLKIRCARITVD